MAKRLQTQGLVRFSDHPDLDYMFLFTFTGKNRVGANVFDQFKDDVKKYPGVNYAPRHGKGYWQAPRGATSHIRQCAEFWLMDVVGGSPAATFDWGEALEPFNEDLYSYQQTAVDRTLDLGSQLLAFEMGLGKTPTAIEAMRVLHARPVLVVCPAIVRQTWVDEIKTWGHGYCAVITSGKQLTAWAKREKMADWTIVSYELLKGALLTSTWEGIVIDEAHGVSNPKSIRSKAVSKLRKNNPDALFLELTGTPIADKPADIYNLLSIMYPQRYGTLWQFKNRYCNVVPCKYSDSGKKHEGLNEAHAPELSARIAQVTSRVTKHEVAHLLPAITTQRIVINADAAETAQTLDGFRNYKAQKHEQVFLNWLKSTAACKTQAVVDLVEASQESSSHIAILTYRRETARQIFEALSSTKGAPPLGLVTGAISQDARKDIIRNLKANPTGIAICTMSSVGIGINDLADWDHAIFAELSYYPVDVLQAVARFHRLSSTCAKLIQFLIAAGSIDEIIAAKVFAKIKSSGKLLKGGVSEEEVAGALSEELSDEDWAAHISDVAKSWIDDELEIL